MVLRGKCILVYCTMHMHCGVKGAGEEGTHVPLGRQPAQSINPSGQFVIIFIITIIIVVVVFMDM